MPTGYTADIAKDITFPEFLWGCARAFGALIEMRDSAPGARIPERFEPSSFYLNEWRKNEARIAELRAMAPEQADAAAQTAYDEEVASRAEIESKRLILLAKYEAMLAQVEAWVPPTPEHAELKTFMGRQIRESMDFDCKPISESKWWPTPIRLPGDVWRAKKIEYATDDAVRCREYYEEEVRRVEGRNEWVRALRESVPVPAKRAAK